MLAPGGRGILPGDLRELRCERDPADDLQVALDASYREHTYRYIRASGEIVTWQSPVVGCGAIVVEA